MRKLAVGVVVVAAVTALALSASAGQRDAGLAVRHGPPALLLTHGLSLNWSGYAAFGDSGAFTDVYGAWTQPTASCSRKQTTYASFWVGLDGYNSDTVEQIGTSADCVRGTPTYSAWYEVYPAPPVELDSSTYPVEPGDHILARVQSNGTVTIADLDQTWRSYTVSGLDFDGAALSSAEWIAEAPSLCSPGACHVAPLTDFGTVTFSLSTANGYPISSSEWDALTMVSNGRKVKAEPSMLTGDGEGFTVTFEHS